jgi:hypothetical protein
VSVWNVLGGSRVSLQLVGVIEDMRKTLCFRSFFSPTARR